MNEQCAVAVAAAVMKENIAVTQSVCLFWFERKRNGKSLFSFSLYAFCLVGWKLFFFLVNCKWFFDFSWFRWPAANLWICICFETMWRWMPMLIDTLKCVLSMLDRFESRKKAKTTVTALVSSESKRFSLWAFVVVCSDDCVYELYKSAIQLWHRSSCVHCLSHVNQSGLYFTIAQTNAHSYHIQSIFNHHFSKHRDYFIYHTHIYIHVERHRTGKSSEVNFPFPLNFLWGAAK